MASDAAREKSAHLMCATPFWGAVAAAASAYFAYSSWERLHTGDLYFQHDWWTTATWIVWIVLIAGVISETRCWRERLYFGVVLLNFLLGFVLSMWSAAPPGAVVVGWRISVALWVLAVATALLTVVAPDDARKGES